MTISLTMPVRPPASLSPAVAATPVARPPATATGGGGAEKHGPPAHASGGGGGGFKIMGINVGRMAMFAALGAAAAAVIPPLAVLGGPIGGAVVGALLSMVL